MSTSGLSGKSHGEKSTANVGKKFQAVNINSVYSGKSLVGQKTSAAPRHGGLQSLCKATAVARRMPPPANLPSLKSESAGQDHSVNIVPSGVAGWGTTQQAQLSSSLPDHQLDAKSPLDVGKKKTPSDGISLRPSGGSGPFLTAGGSKTSNTTASASGGGGTGAGASTNASAGQPVSTTTQGASSSAGRPTWSTRIGTSSSGGNLSVTAQPAQDYPKLSSEFEGSADTKSGSATPSLRPQRSGNWRSGGGYGVKAESESPSPPQNGRDRSRSLSPPPPGDRTSMAPPFRGQHHEQQPPYVQPGYGPRDVPYPHQGPPAYPNQHAPYLHHPYPPALYPPPPPAGYRTGPGGGPPFPPHMPPQYGGTQHDYPYGHHQGPGMPPPPHPAMMQRGYGPVPPQPNRGKHVEESDHGGPPAHPQGPPPPPPPDHYRTAPTQLQRGSEYMPYGGGSRGRPGSDREYGPPVDERGDRWAPPQAYPGERDPRYRENTVWSDDEGDDQTDRRYGRGDIRRNRGEKQQQQHAYSDSEDHYGDNGDWSRYDDQREPVPPRGGRPGHQQAPHMRVHGYPAQPPANARNYPAGPPPNAAGPGVQRGRGDGRYGPPVPGPMPPMQQQRHMYGPFMPPYDHRQMAPPVGYGQNPYHYGRNRDVHDIEAEEEEEIARQQQQQYAREAAMERSKQKRRQGQQIPTPNASMSEQTAAGDSQYAAAGEQSFNEDYEDSEAERSSSRGSFGNKPAANRRQPDVPPRFARQPDSRFPAATAAGHQGSSSYNHGRQPYPQQQGTGPPPAKQYETSTHGRMGQGDAGAYYEKRSPTTYYDNSRKPRNAEYQDTKKGDGQPDFGGGASQAAAVRGDNGGDAAAAPAVQKQLKRPDSKDSLSSQSDRSSNKGEKNSASSVSSGVRSSRMWPIEGTSTVKEDYSSSKMTVDEDNEEDQQFETLSKPKVVVKRTVASASTTEKSPTEQPTVTVAGAAAKEPTVVPAPTPAAPASSVTAGQAPQQQKSPAKGDGAKTTLQQQPPKAQIQTSSSNQKQSQNQNQHHQQHQHQNQNNQGDKSEQSKKNVWEQRKEEFQSKREPSVTTTHSKHSSSKDDKYADYDDDEEEDDEELFGGGDASGYGNWPNARGRGRGLIRGRGRREFVSSRRLHGHSYGTGSTGTRRGGRIGHSSSWDDGGSSSYGRRRGGSVGGYTTTDHQNTKEKHVGGVAEKEATTGVQRDVVASEKQKEKENKISKDSKETADKAENAAGTEGDGKGSMEGKKQQQAAQAEEEKGRSSARGGRATRGRGPVGMRRGYGSSAGYPSERDWNNKGTSYGSGGAVFSRSRGGGGGHGYYRGDYHDDGGGYGDEDGGGYYGSRQRYSNNESYARDGRGARGNANRGGYRAVAPRFQDERGGGAYGSTSGHRQLPSRGGYSGGGGGRAGSERTRGDRAAQSAKSPNSGGGKRENQSEGNDEWETASESSDVGERNRNRNADVENLDKKKHGSIGPKSFSSQRRAPERRRGGATGAGGGSEHRRGADDYPPRKVTEPKDAGQLDQNSTSSGSKNAIVASHQLSSSNSSSRADSKTISKYPTQNINNKRTQMKDEKPAPKPGALATVDINNIAGVVVIDDQPDTSAASENHDGFQEVVSKKRMKKDVQQSEEKERKSQSPSSRRLQPHSGSIGSKTDKTNSSKKPPSTNVGGAPAMLSKSSSSARSSTCDGSGLPVGSCGQWDKKLSSSSTASSIQFTNRPFADHHAGGGASGWGGNESDPASIGGGSAVAVAGGSASQGAGMPSKTGVEIWGTPDPVPFAGASEQQQAALANKCVTRPTKNVVAEVANRPKSVEFIAETFTKGSKEASGVKLDFTFDASLGPFRESKEAGMGDSDENLSRPHQRDSNLVDEKGESSPSADQLSEKIASVKKMWDGVQEVIGDIDETTTTSPHGGGGAFFGGATDAETAAIVSSAASLVSAAVLKSVGVERSSPSGNSDHVHRHVSVYDDNADTSIHKSEGIGGVALGQVPAVGSSSKMEGPNVAKVRPQQMMTEQQQPAQIFLGQDDFGNNGISMNIGGGYPSNSPTPLYAFTGGNNASNSLFMAQFATTKGDFGGMSAIGGQPGMTNYAPFPTAAGANRSAVVGQQAAFVLPPSTSQGLEMPFGAGLLRNNPLGGAADQGMLFGASPAGAAYVPQQPMRNQQAALSKQQSAMNIFGNVQGSFLLQDGGLSLFSHPPPSFGSLTGQQHPSVAAGARGASQQPTPSPGGFDFTQPPPLPPPAPTASAGSLAHQQPPSLAPQQALLQTHHILQAAAGKMSNLTPLGAAAAAGPPPSFGWGAAPQQQKQQQIVQGSLMQAAGGRKGFNPTIGPPNSQQKISPVGGPAAAVGMLGLMPPSPAVPAAIMGHHHPHPHHMYGAVGPSQPLSISTGPNNNPLMGMARRPPPLSIGGGGPIKNQAAASTGNGGGPSKRDGDLLQQMDKFINSTGDEDCVHN